MHQNEFKPLELGDRDIFDTFLREDPPQISELTFTNLFIWRRKYQPAWQIRHDCLLITMQPAGQPAFGLPPVGSGDKPGALADILEGLRRRGAEPRIERVDTAFIHRYIAVDSYYTYEFDRDNSDYVYRTEDLIHLAGRKYHRKKNQLNRFNRQYEYQYRAMDLEMVECFLGLQADWCQIRQCSESPELLSEDHAIYQALTYFEELGYIGGGIAIEGRIEAFALGEVLNPSTAVIHFEKANPEIPGLYAAINQLFCSNAWAHMTFVNREQDLGLEGLRQAKESYYPDHMVAKYTVHPR